MELTWIAILASLLMGAAGLLIFIWAVQRDLFRDFEEVKYQVFWSDLQAMAETPSRKESQDALGTHSAGAGGQ
jgi:nitrogen fixation-related uncharacterized protein